MIEYISEYIRYSDNSPSKFVLVRIKKKKGEKDEITIEEKIYDESYTHIALSPDGKQFVIFNKGIECFFRHFRHN